MSFPPLLDCWYLTGPTASGKTSVGLQLAKRLHAEIISLDSMALYRGMDIGTAKPPLAERADVPHHLIDVIEPHEPFSVARYVAAAHDKAAEIKTRGRQVLFVGGTPLYLKAMVRGLFQGPEADWAFREQLQRQIGADGPDALHARLAEVDPASADKLHPNDTRRVIRSLEVFHLTGRPISQLQREFDNVTPPELCRVFVLDWPREMLYERINRRVDAMFSAGLVEEVGRLIGRDKPLSRTASQAVGYRETIAHLSGDADLDETIGRIKTRTRQFAKRQMTWFRSLQECRAVAVDEGEGAEGIAGRITKIP